MEGGSLRIREEVEDWLRELLLGLSKQEGLLVSGIITKKSMSLNQNPIETPK